MRTRWLTLAATIWTGAYLVAYLEVVHRDGNPPAWWYVGLLAVGAVPIIATAAGWRSRTALVASAGILGLATVLGLLSIGILLVPALVCVIVAACVMTSPARPLPVPR